MFGTAIQLVLSVANLARRCMVVSVTGNDKSVSRPIALAIAFEIPVANGFVWLNETNQGDC